MTLAEIEAAVRKAYAEAGYSVRNIHICPERNEQEPGGLPHHKVPARVVKVWFEGSGKKPCQHTVFVNSGVFDPALPVPEYEEVSDEREKVPA